MTFEKALEAMRNGYEVKRKSWHEDTLLGLDADGKRVYVYNTKHPEFSTYDYDIAADDWEIQEPRTCYNSAKPGYNCRCEIKPEEIERLKKTLSENMHIGFEPHKEESTMYTDLEITFKSGETITYKEGEWDDYSYDGKSVAVKKSGAWVGLYNFDNVFCVELKKREG